ncbi:MAG: transposase [Gammaproteobacteria bacterium]|nr:transposase [Gammaproteobacteria bacterium]
MMLQRATSAESKFLSLGENNEHKISGTILTTLCIAALIRAVYRLFQGIKVRVLVDSWFMRRCFIESMEQRGFDVFGQVRRDTRLYEEPPKRKRGQRGRPRKYGEKYTPKRIAHFKRTEATRQLYGRPRDVRYRSKITKARFF